MYAPSGENVGSDIYNGLTALQHRGQEAAGISVSETDGPRGNIRTKKGMGLVSEVFEFRDCHCALPALMASTPCSNGSRDAKRK